MVVITTSYYIQIITAAKYAAALFYTVITFRRSKKLDQITQTNAIMYSWRDLEIELDKVPPGSDYDISRKQWVYRMFNDIEWLCFLINENPKATRTNFDWLLRRYISKLCVKR